MSNSSRRIPPGKMRRAHPTTLLDTKLVLSRDFEIDSAFMDLWTKHMMGKCPAGMTRLSLSNIKPGFLKAASSGEIEHFEEKTPESDISLLVAHILTGSRPALYVYRSSLASQDSFFCPDDLTAYHAYNLLGIKKVPVFILDYQLSDLEESAICVSAVGPGTHTEICFAGTEAATFEALEVYGGLDQKQDIAKVTGVLQNEIAQTADKVRRFHVSNTSGLHYHHTLVSVLRRLGSSLRAIEVLASQRLYDEAVIQLRAMYELALNFYLDWLAPEKIGPRLQLLALDENKKWSKASETHYQKKLQQGWSSSAIKQLKAADNRLQDLIGKVSEKAKINPLHTKHAELYRFLSRFAHQDFVITARHAHVLETGEDPVPEPELVEHLIMFSNLITAQIVTRIDADIGDRDRAQGVEGLLKAN